MVNIELSKEQVLEIVADSLPNMPKELGKVITDSGWADVVVKEFFKDKLFLCELAEILVNKNISKDLFELVEEYNNES